MQSSDDKQVTSDVDNVANNCTNPKQLNSSQTASLTDNNTHLKSVDVNDEEKEILQEPEVGTRRFSTRRLKRSVILQESSLNDSSVPSSHTIVSDVISLTTSDDNTSQRKQRRGWKTWTIQDVKTFYDALAEHGKDFSAIQSYIQVKASESQRKGKSGAYVSSSNSSNLTASSGAVSSSSSCITSMSKKDNAINLKSKEQVRHFYYRTWHKISPALADITKVDVLTGCCEVTSPDKTLKCSTSDSETSVNDVSVDNAVLELYGLINYGEIWKRTGGTWNDKIKCHLRELVLEGVTVIKSINKNVKSKTTKIKTPLCKALKKINNFASEIDPVSTSCSDPLPDQISLELTPLNNYSFLKVQSLAQNPCVKLKVESSAKISDLVEYLECNLWSPNNFKKHLQLQFLNDTQLHTSSSSKHDSRVNLTLTDSIITSLESSKSCIKISKQSTPPLGDTILSSPSTSKGINTETSTHSLSNLSFKSYVNRFNKLPNASQPSKSGSGKKTSSGSTSARSLLKNFHNSSDEGKKDSPAVVIETLTPSPVKSSFMMVDGEESCSSSSSIGPLRETVKKLAQLNKALSMTNESSQDSMSNLTTSSSRVKPVSPSQDKNTPVEPAQAPSGPLESTDKEVSLPPPTSTLAQWLNSKEHQRQLGESLKLSTENAQSNVNDSTKETITAKNDHQSPCKHVDDDFNEHIITVDSVRNGWSSSVTSMTFGQLFMLLKSPEYIEMNYEFKNIKSSPEISAASRSEQQYLMQSLNLEERHKDSMCLLDKLLFVASISLSTFKKTTSPVSCSFQANLRSTNNLKAQNKGATVSSSSSSSPSSSSSSSQSSTCSVSSSGQMNSPQNATGQHNFLVPSAPAPRSLATTTTTTPVNNVTVTHVEAESSIKPNKRQKFITKDPQVLQEALKQMNESRLVPRKRQRIRPTPVIGTNIPLLPRLTANTLMTQTPIQIVTHPSQLTNSSIPVQHTVTESLSNGTLNSVTGQSVTTTGGLSLPICLTSPGGPTILIPIATNLNNGTLTSTSVQATSLVQSSNDTVVNNTVEIPRQTLTPIVLPSSPFAESNVQQHSTLNSLNSSTNETINTGINHQHENSSVIFDDKMNQCSSLASNLPSNTGNSSSSASSLPCLSSLLELSLPETIAASSSLTSTVSHAVTSSSASGPNLNSTAFFNDNSCSSISEFISFMQTSNSHNPVSSDGSTLNTPIKGIPSHEDNIGNNHSLNDVNSIKPPSWLLNEGSNSNSLGLSSLAFPSTELSFSPLENRAKE